MDIYVLDGLNGAVNIVSDYQSVIWNMQYYGLSEFQLTVTGTKENIDLLKPGRYLVRDIDRTATAYNNVMIIESIKLVYEIESGWLLTVSGKGLKNILNKRIVWDQLISSGTVEDAIRDAITASVISPSNSDREIDDFEMDAALGLLDEEEIQLLGESLGDWVSSVCQTYGYGWDIYISGGKYRFKLYLGTDRTYNQSSVPPVVFSPALDNLLEFDYTYDSTKYANAALVGGEGEGINMRTATIGDATGLDRTETFIDGSEVSSNGEIITLETYTAMLESFGKEQLANLNALKADFQGSIDTNSSYVMNQDYFLGDIVQIDNNAGISATSRIIEIIYCEEANGISVVPTFTEWEVQ